MSAIDIINGNETLSFQQQNILLGMLNGLVVMHEGVEYRFAEKDEELYEEGDQFFVANESSIFKKMNTINTHTNIESFIWISRGENISSLLNLIRNLTEEERISALANISLNRINNIKGFKK
jgi:hypothetical protein